MERIGFARRVIALVALVFLAACASAPQKMTAQDKARIKSARISPEMELAPAPFLLAPGDGTGLMFGAVGGAAAASPIERSRLAFVAYLEKNGISIQKLALEAFEAALRESNKIAIAAPGDASAPQFRVALPQYGFGVPHLASSSVVPVLWMKCEMVDGAGKVLWSASDRMLTLGNPIESTTWEAMRDNPKVIEAEWRKALRYSARKIVAEL